MTCAISFWPLAFSLTVRFYTEFYIIANGWHPYMFKKCKLQNEGCRLFQWIFCNIFYSCARLYCIILFGYKIESGFACIPVANSSCAFIKKV